MIDSKLIELLRSFSARRLSHFGEFLQSPYFNKNRDCLLFFNYLQKYAPSFEHKDLSRETILKKPVSEKPLDEKALAHLASRLSALAEKFLAVDAILSDGWKQHLVLAQQFQEHHLPRHYRSARAALEKLLEAFPYRNTGYFRERLLAERLFYEHSDRNQRGFNEQLQVSAHALDVYFIAEKLRYACEMLNYEAVLNIHYDVAFLDEVLAWSASDRYATFGAVQVYRNLVLMLKNPDEPAFFEKARSLTATSEHIFQPQELRQLYTLLLNYCTRRINRHGDAKFLYEHLEINKLLLKNGLIFEDGRIPPWDFTNIVTVGLKTDQTGWTWQFLHDYRDRLPAEYADNVFRYNLAQYHYYLKNYDDAQRALVQVEISDVLLNVTVRSLLIKIYCETGQTDLLFACLEATRIFLHRNQLLDPQIKKQMQKFVEYTAKFAKVIPGERERYRDLLEHLPPARDMMHREWLAGQIIKSTER